MCNYHAGESIQVSVRSCLAGRQRSWDIAVRHAAICTGRATAAALRVRVDVLSQGRARVRRYCAGAPIRQGKFQPLQISFRIYIMAIYPCMSRSVLITCAPMIGGAIRGYGARELLAGAVADARRGGKVLQITWCKRMHASQLRRRKRLHTLPDISLTHRTALPSAEHAVRANRTRGRETGEQCHARTHFIAYRPSLAISSMILNVGFLVPKPFERWRPVRIALISRSFAPAACRASPCIPCRHRT